MLHFLRPKHKNEGLWMSTKQIAFVREEQVSPNGYIEQKVDPETQFFIVLDVIRQHNTQL